MSDSETQEPYDLTYREDAPRIRTREGVELYYESSGDGPAITMLNNFFVTAPFWRSHTQVLAKNHRIVSYDLANHGASVRLGQEPTWKEHAADVIGLLDALGIDATYLVATSASCQLARDLALAHPDRVKGLVLAGPVFGLKSMRRHRQFNRAMLQTLQSSGMAALYNHIYPAVVSGQMNEEGGTPGFLGLRESFLAMSTPDQITNGIGLVQTGDPSSTLLSQVAAPSLLVLGDDDMLLSTQRGHEVAALFPDGRCAIIPGAGHMPFLDDPELFETLVAEFVEEVESRA